MKKTILIAFAVAALAGLLVAGVAFAQDDTPPFGDRGPKERNSELHSYMTEAVAEALGITVEELEASKEAGENIRDLAEAQGLSDEELSTLMQEARAAALDAALGDGVITQEEYDAIEARGFGRGGKHGSEGNSELRSYMSEAIAEALGMTVEELEASKEAGENFRDIVEAQGLSDEELSTLMQEARSAALDAALEDGVITQEQLDEFESRDGGFGPGGRHGGRGNNDGTGERPFGGEGFQGKGGNGGQDGQGTGFSG